MVLGTFIVIIFVFTATFSHTLAPYGYTEFHLEATLQPPSQVYVFGTDAFGRDVFSRVLVGSWSILVLASSATALAMILGISTGMVAGYYGGLVDEVVMRVMDILMCLPTLLLALLILTGLGPGLNNLVLAIAFVFMPRVARIVRSMVLGIKPQEFVEAAMLRGESAAYIMFREILPNAFGPIMVESAMRFNYAIFLGASLGFLGLGMAPPTPDWGLMVSESQRYVLIAPWTVAFPCLAIIVVVIGVNLLADGLQYLIWA